MTTQATSQALHFHAAEFAGAEPGPSLVVLGAVHGNETCGTKAILRVMGELAERRLAIVRGRVTFVPVTNPLAYSRGQRAGDRNLNRNLRPTLEPVDIEDRVANWLCPLLARHEVLLDLHSTRSDAGAFAMLGPEDNAGALQPFALAEKERALAVRLGVGRFVDGWLETYARGVERRSRRAAGSGDRTPGPGDRSKALQADARYGVGTTEYMRSVGGCAITLECGQHEDPASPEVAWRAIHNTLAHLGLTDSPPPEPVAKRESLRLYEVIDREHAEDSFSRSWTSFEPLRRGDVIGTRKDGTAVVAEADGCIVFPDTGALPGSEWFYLAKRLP